MAVSPRVVELQQRGFTRVSPYWHLATKVGGPPLCEAPGKIMRAVLARPEAPPSIAPSVLCSACVWAWAGWDA